MQAELVMARADNAKSINTAANLTIALVRSEAENMAYRAQQQVRASITLNGEMDATLQLVFPLWSIPLCPSLCSFAFSRNGVDSIPFV